jgi:hypothetical protein
MSPPLFFKEKTMKKSIFRFTLLLLLMSIFLIGCTQKKQDYGNNYVFEEDDQYSFLKQSTAVCTMAKSSNGYYFFSGPDNSFLYFIDKTNLKAAILCNKPDCLHTDETDSKKITNCNAIFYFSNRNLIYYKSNLYLIGKGMTGEASNYSLIEVSCDGTQRKEIIKFKDHPTCLIIHRGFVYYTTEEKSDENKNQEDISISKCKLYCININKPNEDAKMITEIEGFYKKIGGLMGYGNYIFFFSMGYQDSSLQKPEGGIFCYNTINGVTNEIIDNAGNFSICRDKIIYSWIGNKYSCSLDGSGKKLLDNINGYIFCDDKYIYADSFPQKLTGNQQESQIKRTLSVYDIDGNLLETIDIDNIGIDNLISGGDENYLFIPDNHSLSNEYGEIKSLWFIKKATIGSGSTKLEKLFEFVPKVQFPGVVRGVN